MDNIQFPYRSSSHLALMHVINESGAWERNGIRCDYDKPISRSDAHELVPKGEVEFVSGNHVSTYAARARGDTWVYLGQTMCMNSLTLVTRNDTGINALADCRKRKFGSRGRHPGLNTWLYLKQAGLDADKDEVELIEEVRVTLPDGDEMGAKKPLLGMVADGDVDACFINQPGAEFARRKGLKCINIAKQPMVFFMTVSSSMKLVQNNPDLVKRNLKAVIEGIAYFKQNREESIKILLAKHRKEGALDRDAAEKLWADIAPRLDPGITPSLQAVYNVYQEALKQDEKNGDAKRIHPLALWDFHFVRELDDQGFVRNLYKNHPKMLEEHGG